MNTSTKLPTERPNLMVFLYTTIGILVAVILIHYVTGAEYRDEKDIYNWVSLIAEIGIASGITYAVWKFTKFEQSKTNQILNNINEITEKVDKIIDNQEKLRVSRIKDLHESLYGNLISVITSAYNVNQGRPIRQFSIPNGTIIGKADENQWLYQMSGIISQKIIQDSDILAPPLKAALQTVCNLINMHDERPEHAKAIIEVSKTAIQRIDTSLFSLDHIVGREILENI